MGEVLAHRFELLQLIAQGGSGDVWVAYDRHAKKLCAAKVCRQRDTPNLLRFVREQGVSFSHPHVITPYGWAGNDTDVVIASDLVAGGTLSHALRNAGTLSVPLASELILQLARGLRHVHSEGWVHRDVKPANVLLEVTAAGCPRARLSDFGSAVREEDVRLTHTGFIHGTLGYMPPEVYLGGDPTPAMDWYALGVLGLRLVHHFRPDQKTDARTHLAAAALPAPFAKVINGLLSEMPSERLAAAGALETVLGPLARPDSEHRGFRTAAGKPFVVADTLGLSDLDTANPSVPSAAFPGGERTAALEAPTPQPTMPHASGATQVYGQPQPTVQYPNGPTSAQAFSAPSAPSPPHGHWSPPHTTPPGSTAHTAKTSRLSCGLLAPIALIVAGFAAIAGAVFFPF